MRNWMKGGVAWALCMLALIGACSTDETRQEPERLAKVQQAASQPCSFYDDVFEQFVSYCGPGETCVDDVWCAQSCSANSDCSDPNPVCYGNFPIENAQHCGCRANGETLVCDPETSDGCSTGPGDDKGCRCGSEKACGEGERCCDGNCVDLSDNCGSCGNACDATGTGAECSQLHAYFNECLCSSGQCVISGPGGSTCHAPSKTTCGPNAACIECVDGAGATASCDDAGTTTIADDACKCTGGREACENPADSTQMVCTDLQSDDDNCGSCGNVCGGGKVCQSGSCVCPAGETDCSGTCVDINGTDITNCGGCGTTCTNTGEVCNAGTCECSAGDTLCGSACVNTNSSDTNCGSCGNDCTTSGLTCTGGNCLCGGQDCSLDVDSDGTCTAGNCTCNGVVCGAQEDCVGGTCVIQCNANHECAAEELCNNVTKACDPAPLSGVGAGNICSPGANYDLDYAQGMSGRGFRSNGSRCVDTTTDPTQCWTNTACLSTQVCCLTSTSLGVSQCRATSNTSACVFESTQEWR